MKPSPRIQVISTKGTVVKKATVILVILEDVFKVVISCSTHTQHKHIYIVSIVQQVTKFFLQVTDLA